MRMPSCKLRFALLALGASAVASGCQSSDTPKVTIYSHAAAPVSFQNGSGGYSGTVDGVIVGYQPSNTDWYADFTQTELGVWHTDNGTDNYETEGLIRFDNLSLPAGSTVTSATLTLTFDNWWTGFTMTGYYLKNSWTESNVQWVERDSGLNWASPGALGSGTDIYSGKSFSNSTWSGNGNEVIAFPLDTGIVQGWIDTPSTNQGVLLTNNTAIGANLRVYSSEYGTVSMRPQLDIQYTSGCTPTTCAAAGKNCGTISDGCGGNLNCGSCTSPQTCGGGGVANVCGGGSCTPTTCAAQGKNCGTISDGCGGNLNCGSCTSPQTCGGGGTANVCGSGSGSQQTYQTGSGGYSGTVDGSISGWEPGDTDRDADFTQTQLNVWHHDDGSTHYQIEGIIRFDNLSLPAGATVTSASLTLTFENWDTGFTMTGYYLKNPWNASYVKWVERDSGLNWASPGAKGSGTDIYSGKSFSNSTWSGSGNEVYTFPLDTGIVQGWIDTPSTNQGVILTNNATLNKTLRVYASEYATVSMRPLLTINYTTGGGCTPTTCSAQGKNCGTISDGCGGNLNCGSCTSPQTCGGGGVANVCGGGCTPTTCSAQGKNCGTISDGCGGNLNCGSCTSPETCGGGGTANVCGGGGGGGGGGGSSPDRYRSVSTRGTQVTLTGYTDTIEWIGAYQQTADPSLSSLRGSAYPDTGSGGTDACGVTWYPWSLTITLASTDSYWFSNGARPEYTQVLLKKLSTGAVVYTPTGDVYDGPSDSGTCGRTVRLENDKQLPVVFYHGTLPADLDCSGGDKSPLGCPFDCNLTIGCDASYGTTENHFTSSSYRVTMEGQSTDVTRFDNYGATSATGAPPGDWYYQYESGRCIGGNMQGYPCNDNGPCTLGGACLYYSVVKRRNNYTADSLNLRRGENRRNVYIDAWVKNMWNDSSNREIGLVGRWYNADNYFVFMVREYGGDYARLQRRSGGVFGSIATASPTFTLTDWLKLGFKIIDQGSWTDTQFVPDGTCWLGGYINGNLEVYSPATACSQNPYGLYGMFSYYNSNAQVYNLDAYACNPTNFSCY